MILLVKRNINSKKPRMEQSSGHCKTTTRACPMPASGTHTAPVHGRSTTVRIRLSENGGE